MSNGHGEWQHVLVAMYHAGERAGVPTWHGATYSRALREASEDTVRDAMARC